MAMAMFSRYESRKRRELNMSDEDKEKRRKQKAEYARRPEVLEKLNRNNKIFQKEIRRIRIELGRCTTCDKDLDSLKFRRCSECRLRCRESARNNDKSPSTTKRKSRDN